MSKNDRVIIPPELLSDLADVDITGIVDDSFLKYNSITGFWEIDSTAYASSSAVFGPLTSGYLPYYDGTDFDNSPIYTDGTNIGLGATSASEKLRVVSADNLSTTTIISAYANNLTAGIGLDYNGIKQLGNNRQLNVNANGTGVILIGGLSSGNVGFGSINTSPASKISVLGNLSIGSSYYTTAAPTNGMIVEGNVGIGTTSPSTKLDVNGIASADTFNATTDTLVSQSGTTIINYDSTLGNFSFGANSLNSITVGSDNIAVGNDVLKNNTAGGFNVAIGDRVLENLNAAFSIASNNVAIGFRALQNPNNARGNVAIGQSAMGSATSSSVYDNVAIGRLALSNSSFSGVSNTVIGFQAGTGATTSSNNILIGAYAGDNITTGDDNIIIGYDIDAPSATASNQLNIGNTIYGDLSTGNVGIGTTSPSAQLQVNTSSASTIGQIIQTSASQTANLLELQNSSGTILSSFNEEGQLRIGSTETSKQFVFDANRDGQARFRTVSGTRSMEFSSFSADHNYMLANGSQFRLGSQSSNELWFLTNNTIRGGIKGSDGKWAVGTTSFTAQLGVRATSEQLRLEYDASNYFSTTLDSNGQTNFEITTATSTNGFYFNNAINTYSTSSGDSRIYFRNPNVAHGITNVLPTDAAGYIGTVNNDGALSFVGATEDADFTPLVFEGIIGGASTTVAAIDFRASVKVGAGRGNLATGDLAINFDDALYVVGGGNVGVGTSTPSYLLDVDGTAKVDTLRLDEAASKVIIDYAEEPDVSSSTLSTSTTGGTLSANTYYLSVTYLDADGHETEPSDNIDTSITTTGSTSTITINNLPLSSNPNVTQRNVYMGTSSVFQNYQVTVANNTDTSVTITSNNTTIGNDIFRNKYSTTTGFGNTLGGIFENEDGDELFSIGKEGQFYMTGERASLIFPQKDNGQFDSLPFYILADTDVPILKDDYSYASMFFDINDSDIFKMGTFGRGAYSAKRVEIHSDQPGVEFSFNIQRGAGTTGWISVSDGGTSSANQTFVYFDPTQWTASGGINRILSLSNTINMSGSAGYEALQINITETSTGSGVRNLINANVDGSSMFSVDADGNLIVEGTTTLNSDTLVLSTSKTPSSASDTGTQGQIAWDADYIYICTATDTWKRVAIATW